MVVIIQLINNIVIVVILHDDIASDWSDSVVSHLIYLWTRNDYNFSCDNENIYIFIKAA